MGLAPFPFFVLILEPDDVHFALGEPTTSRRILKGHGCTYFQFLLLFLGFHEDLESNAYVQCLVNMLLFGGYAHFYLVLVVNRETSHEAGVIPVADSFWDTCNVVVICVHVAFDLGAIRVERFLMLIPLVDTRVVLPFRPNNGIIEGNGKLLLELDPVFPVDASVPHDVSVGIQTAGEPLQAVAVMSFLRVRVRASIDGLFKLLNPDGEVLGFVLWGEVLDAEGFAVGFQMLSVGGVIIVWIVLCL